MRSAEVLPTGCWFCYLNPNGVYARVQVEDGRNRSAHLVVYELLVGSVPDGLELDHTCQQKHCVNPWHLEPVTRRDNILRGGSPSANALRIDHCKRGHPLDRARVKPNGARDCIECHRIHSRNWQRRHALRRA